MNGTSKTGIYATQAQHLRREMPFRRWWAFQFLPNPILLTQQCLCTHIDWCRLAHRKHINNKLIAIDWIRSIISISFTYFIALCFMLILHCSLNNQKSKTGYWAGLDRHLLRMCHLIDINFSVFFSLVEQQQSCWIDLSIEHRFDSIYPWPDQSKYGRPHN